MNWFKYEIGDTVETPIGDAIVMTEPDEFGKCFVSMLQDDIRNGCILEKAGTQHELTTFQFSKILKKKSEDYSFKSAKEMMESFIQVSLQIDPQSLIKILQVMTNEKWEYHHGDCCNKGRFIRTGVKL